MPTAPDPAKSNFLSDVLTSAANEAVALDGKDRDTLREALEEWLAAGLRELARRYAVEHPGEPYVEPTWVQPLRADLGRFAQQVRLQAGPQGLEMVTDPSVRHVEQLLRYGNTNLRGVNDPVAFVIATVADPGKI